MRDKYRDIIANASKKDVPFDAKMIEERIPPIRLKKEGENTGEYFNYVFDLIDTAMHESEIGRIIDVERSPVFKIWKLSGSKIPLTIEQVSEIHKCIRQIELIKNSLTQRPGFFHKLCFYYIWTSWEEGKDWNAIYEKVNAIQPFQSKNKETGMIETTDKYDAIRTMKKMPKRFEWEKGANKNYKQR